jgi:chitodextrinase
VHGTKTIGCRVGAAALTTVLLNALVGAAAAQACGLDGIPSLRINGVLAKTMTSKPDRAQLAHWAPFIFPTPYRPGESLRLQENLTELKRSLPAQAFVHPWRWTFGDGTTAVGFTARHVYRHAGEYRITITAYYAAYGAWYEFDNALVRVR